MREHLDESSRPLPAPELARHPGYLALKSSLDEYVSEVDRLFVPPASSSVANRREERDETGAAHQRRLDYMLHS